MNDIDVRFIASYMTEDIHVFNEEILLEDDISRREFLAKVLSTASVGLIDPSKLMRSLATGAITGKALLGVKDAVASMSNAELSETPEDLWLPYISDGRLRDFIQEHPDHFETEVVNKYVALITYIQQPDATTFGTAKRALEIMQARAKVNPSIIINKALRSPRHVLNDVILASDGVDAQVLIKAGKTAGVYVDEDAAQSAIRRTKDAVERNRQTELERDRRRREYYDELNRANKHEWEAVVHGGLGSVGNIDKMGVERYKQAPHFDESRKRRRRV